MNRRKFLTGTATGAAGIATFGLTGGKERITVVDARSR